jgi:hypothetical protein
MSYADSYELAAIQRLLSFRSPWPSSNTGQLPTMLRYNLGEKSFQLFATREADEGLLCGEA